MRCLQGFVGAPAINSNKYNSHKYAGNTNYEVHTTHSLAVAKPSIARYDHTVGYYPARHAIDHSPTPLFCSKWNRAYGWPAVCTHSNSQQRQRLVCSTCSRRSSPHALFPFASLTQVTLPNASFHTFAYLCGCRETLEICRRSGSALALALQLKSSQAKKR